MKLLDEYFAIQERIYAHFGCEEGWQQIPIIDSRRYYWRLDDGSHGKVYYATTEEELKAGEGAYYEDGLIDEDIMPSSIYRAADYTMVCVAPQTDFNKLLLVFSNARERGSATQILRDGTEEASSIPIVRYRDKDGNPTCAVDFPAGKVCVFCATQKFGCSETCLFADKDGQRWAEMQRRDGGYGTLIPLQTCPIWQGQEK